MKIIYFFILLSSYLICPISNTVNQEVNQEVKDNSVNYYIGDSNYTNILENKFASYV